MPGIFQVYPGFPRYTRKIPGIIANLAEFGRKPASRLGSDPEKLMIPLSFVIYHTTLCSYHTTPQENQISGKYHSFTSKWPSLIPSHQTHPHLSSLAPHTHSHGDFTRAMCT